MSPESSAPAAAAPAHAPFRVAAPVMESFSYDDAIVRKFFLATVVWGAVAMLAGLFIALQLALPKLGFDVAFLGFGRLRPLHTNAAIFAFAGNAIFAAVYYSTQRLCKARMFSDTLSLLHFRGWQAIIVAAAITLPLGYTQGKEYAELEWPIDVAIAVVWVGFFGVNFFGTLVRPARAAHVRRALVLHRDHRHGRDAPRLQQPGPGTIFLDKTGTITRGATTLVRWHGDDSLQPLVASLESESAHPIARALVAAFTGSPAAPAPSGVRPHQSGIEGVVAGVALRIGSPAFVRGLDRSGRLAAVEKSIIAAGLTPILVAVNGRIAAAAGLGDPVRPDARESIDRLRRMGSRVGILSGDHPDLVAAVGRSLGLDPADVRGGVPPEEKLAIVAAAAKAGPVIMVGDGVNDAAALAAATGGVAVHGGAEASLAAADVYLGSLGLAPIADLILASRRTMGVIRCNFAASIFYNAVAAALAMAGLLSPLIAAFLMPISSLTVLTLSFRTRTFGDRPCR